MTRPRFCRFTTNAELASFMPPPATLGPYDIAPRGAHSSCCATVSIETVAQQEEWAPLGAMSYGPSVAGGGMNEASSAFVVNRQNRGLVMIGANGGAQYASRPKSYQRQRWQV